jgi:hypothetical protein
MRTIKASVEWPENQPFETPLQDEKRAIDLLEW